MLRRWRVVAVDVNGRQIGEIGRFWFRWSAERRKDQADTEVWEPIPGRKLYEHRVVSP